MADNVTADPGTGGATFATDDDGTAHHPYVKLEWGADNTQTKVAAGANALPIQDGGNAITVDGTVAVSGTVTVDGSGVTQPVSNAGLTELAAAINASSQMDVNIAASAATVAVSNAGLTELAAAINASSQMDVNIAASAATVTVTGAGGTFPVTDSGGSLTVDNTVLSVVGGGTEAAAQRVTIASDSTGVLSVDDNGSTLSVDDGAGSLTVDGTVAATQSGTWTVQPGNTANSTPWLVTPTPATSGGLTIFRSIDLDETEEEVKGTAGQVFNVWVTNTATSTRFVKFYNATAANVTVGTTTPVITIGIPGNSSDDISGNFTAGTHGIAFGTAITVAATTGVADADTGAPGADEVIINIFYK